MSFEDERRRYDQHCNGSEGHRSFLKPVVEQVKARHRLGTRGLDWGCGPDPVCIEMLSTEGFQMVGYDLHYQPVKPARQEYFGFITLTEVIEHIYDPVVVLKEVASHLELKGKLYIMTEPHPGPAGLESWSYRRDPTHVTFWNEKSLKALATRVDLSFEGSEGRVFIFQKIQT